MHEVRCNHIENQLIFTLKGKLDAAEIKTACVLLLSNARKLQPGFIKITDIREMEPAPEEGRLELQNTMRTLIDAGLGAAIRIISDAYVITANQFQRTSRQAGYTAMEVHSLTEAERAIDKLME